MKINEYARHADAIAAPSTILRDCFFAFIVGGSICSFGQMLVYLYNHFGLDGKTSLTLSSITLIFLSCLLTGIGWYDKLASFAGAGTLVPITGFANAMSSPAIDNTAEGLVLGLGSKIFIICGPVILYGSIFACILGLIAVLLRNFGIDLTGVI